MKMKQTMKNENKYENAENMNMNTKAMTMMNRRRIIQMSTHDNKVSYENENNDESEENYFETNPVVLGGPGSIVEVNEDNL